LRHLYNIIIFYFYHIDFSINQLYMYTAVLIDSDPTKAFLPYENEDLDNVKEHISHALARVIDDEIYKQQIDIDDTQYKDYFTFHKGKYRLKNRSDLTHVSNFSIMMYIQGYNTRVIEWIIHSTDPEDEDNQIDLEEPTRLEELLPRSEKNNIE
jgi:hypothetical protein